MIIFRILRNTFLILLIVLIILAPLCIYLIKFKGNSFPGDILKSGALKTPKLAEILNLNNPGDARNFYLDPDRKSLSVGVISVNFKDPNEEVGMWLKDMIFETTNKYVIVGRTQSFGYPKTSALQDLDFNKIRKDAISLGKKDLYLIYASSYADKQSSAGLVIHRDTIFIFKDAIDRLSERGYVKDILEKTTIMHEWGHLLGIDHIDDEGCIMNDSVEVLDAIPSGKNLPSDYCSRELREIQR